MSIMTIRGKLKYRYRLMICCGLMVPPLGFLWLQSSTPLNHTFRSGAIGIVEIAVFLLFLATFRCPNCHKTLSPVWRKVVFDPEFCGCSHCGIDLNQTL
jgi:hypothetical protein